MRINETEEETEVAVTGSERSLQFFCRVPSSIVDRDLLRMRAAGGIINMR